MDRTYFKVTVKHKKTGKVKVLTSAGCNGFRTPEDMQKHLEEHCGGVFPDQDILKVEYADQEQAAAAQPREVTTIMDMAQGKAAT